MSNKLTLIPLCIVMVALAAPAVAALNPGCFSQVAGPLTVVAGPMSQAFGWSPACVTLESGGSVAWQVVDPIAHSVLVQGCFDSDVLLPGEGAAATFLYDAATGQ